jgi:tetratricopeptide (TPR) repeat protein
VGSAGTGLRVGRVAWLDVADAASREATVAVTDSERVALLHLAGVALMDKALNGERAIDALRGVLALGAKPGVIQDDAFVRLRLLFDELGQHEDLAQLLASRVAGETDTVAKVEMLLALADLHRNFLDDRDKAAEYLRAITELDPTNRAAVASLSDIAWEKGDWAVAAEALILRARLEPDPQVLKHVFYRLGTIYSDRIPDHRWALRSFQKVLAYDPEDRGALEKLSELSVLTADWKR